MCNFCIKHGAGKKWYLNMANYSRDLEKDPERRQVFLKFLEELEKTPVGKIDEQLKAFRIPVLGNILRWKYGRYFEKTHCGQVVPIEDAIAVLNIANPIVRVPCICRHVYGKKEKVCLGFGLISLNLVDKLSFARGHIEQLTADEAKEFVRKCDERGLVHTVWTIKTPYIFAMCQCTHRDCLGLRMRLDYGVKKILRMGEYVSEVDIDEFTGCGECVEACQFKALSVSPRVGRATVDSKKCFGCGLCRAFCPVKAINLTPRLQHSVARSVW